MRKNAIAVLLLVAGCASIPADAPLSEREQVLLHALVNREPAKINQLIADDFTCEVRAPGFTSESIVRPVRRFDLCTGLGHRRPGPGPDSTQFDLTRSAVIRSIDVAETDGTATVTMEQSYFGWMPYDGPFERRSRVIDTWTRNGGEWRLAKRVSEPLS